MSAYEMDDDDYSSHGSYASYASFGGLSSRSSYHSYLSEPYYRPASPVVERAEPVMGYELRYVDGEGSRGKCM